MQLSFMAARAAVYATVGLACASCGSSTRNQSTTTLSAPTEPLCAATVPGAEISLEDAPEGATILYETRTPDQVDVMRAEAHLQTLSPPRARASGGSPLPTEALPAVQTHVKSHRRGIAVTFTALDPGDTERLRAIVWNDVQRQRRGECSKLRLAGAATESSAAPASQGWKLSLTGVDIDAVIADTCGILPSKTFVVFDTAYPRKGDAVALETLAGCVAKGRYSGGPLKILSYSPADDDEFARIFGRSRAESVAQWLGSLGVDTALIQVERSRAHSPSDTDDRGWQWSKRVSISPAR